LNINIRSIVYLLLSSFPFSLSVSQSLSDIPKVNDTIVEINQNSPDSVKINIYEYLFENNRYSKPHEAIKYADSLLKLYTDKKNYIKYVYTLNRLGRTYVSIGKLSDAQPCLTSAAKIAEYTGDLRGLRLALTNIAATYIDQQNFKTAKEYLKKSLNLAVKINDPCEISYVLNAFGLYYTTQAKPDTALIYFEQSIDGFKRGNDLRGLATAYNNVASANYNKNGDVNITIEYYKKNLEIQKTIKNYFIICLTLTNIANVYKDNGDYQQSLKYFEKSIEICKCIDAITILQLNYKDISATYDSIKDYKNAFEYLALSAELKDSLKSGDMDWILAEAMAKYENEKKEKEILSLKNDNNLKELDLEKQESRITNQRAAIIIILVITVSIIILVFFLLKLYKIRTRSNQELMKKNNQIALQKNEIEEQRDRIKRQRDEMLAAYDKLKELDATKDKFFTIIAHDIKNPVFNMQRIIEQLNKKYEIYSEEQRRRLIDTVDKSAGQLHTLLLNLLQWAKSQTGKIPHIPEKIDLYDIIKRNIELYQPYADKKTIYIKLEIQEILNVFADEKMTNVIIQNLLGNAIKFTHAGGLVKIKVAVQDEMAEITIEDNGVGMSEEDIRKIFQLESHHTTHGTNKEEGTGLGLILCKEFIEKNGGSIQVQSTVGNGSIFRFTLPTKEPIEVFETENL
jgi:signal transduction histidine kinase/Tfp pilus assembly protein PilF